MTRGTAIFLLFGGATVCCIGGVLAQVDHIDLYGRILIWAGGMMQGWSFPVLWNGTYVHS